MDKLKWYDYLAVFVISDIAAGVILSILSGYLAGVFMFPMLIMIWLSYEIFRGAKGDKDTE